MCDFTSEEIFFDFVGVGKGARVLFGEVGPERGAGHAHGCGIAGAVDGVFDQGAQGGTSCVSVGGYV